VRDVVCLCQTVHYCDRDCQTAHWNKGQQVGLVLVVLVVVVVVRAT
jgi:hypothetical protein